MRAFILHDGEDDERSQELHEFLSPLKAAGGDWEGDNSGITIWMPPVAVGDAIVVDHDGLGVRVYPKNQPIKITRHAFRHVYAAILLIEHDNGAHHMNRIHGPGTVDLDTFTVPFEYGIDRLLNADLALGWLRDENSVEFEDLVIGEQGDQMAVVRRHRDEQPGLAIAHDLLNAWFDGWQRPYKWEQT